MSQRSPSVREYRNQLQVVRFVKMTYGEHRRSSDDKFVVGLPVFLRMSLLCETLDRKFGQRSSFSLAARSTCC